MNLAKPVSTAASVLRYLQLWFRRRLPQQQCSSFTALADVNAVGIGPIVVINLDREPGRLAELTRELGRVLDAGGRPLSERVIRFPACDAQSEPIVQADDGALTQCYTLADQLFVEPQPLALPDCFDLERPIKMSPAESAIARSHVAAWKAIAESPASYTLVLEDDVWLKRSFASVVDHAWMEMRDIDGAAPEFDVLYVSYKEVRYGAPKTLASEHIFRPERGLWFLSGYVLSRKGARALLGLLPCRGPVDLWINHKFRDLDVRALRRSVIDQRLDTPSTNSYSILPVLARIGVLDEGAGLFRRWPTHEPVFAFGSAGSGLTSLAMALSMLGYRCCSDLDTLPEVELGRLMAGSTDRVFGAYVNVESLLPRATALALVYPRAKFILVGHADLIGGGLENALQGADVLRLEDGRSTSWLALCEHLRLPPLTEAYPTLPDVGQRRSRPIAGDAPAVSGARRLRHDRSPWIAEPRSWWTGLNDCLPERAQVSGRRVHFEDAFQQASSDRWTPRSDTFPGNLGLFRPANVSVLPSGGLSLAVVRESLGVRDYSAAAISSRRDFLHGRFEATLQAARVPGIVTGFFLHRDSPRQEIDIEITGDRPDRLLVNVFYNPGLEGAKFDYGYRGTPVSIPLGFDASKAAHRFAIEWDTYAIRWFVDDKLVHRRGEWAPTPIPDRPMTLHVNVWPTRSRELAGRLGVRSLPAKAIARRITVNAYDPNT